MLQFSPLLILKPSLSSFAFEYIDECDPKCVKGKQLMEEIYSSVHDYLNSCTLTPEGIPHDKYPKDLLPLQSAELWQTWADLDKEQYRQRNKHKYVKSMAHSDKQGTTRELPAREYSEEQRKKMRKIREKQYGKVKEKSTVTEKFINALRTDDTMVLWYFMQWLKIALDDLSQKMLPPLYTELHQLRTKLSDIQGKGPALCGETTEKACLKELQQLDARMVNASFGVEHLMREVSQQYEAVVENGAVFSPPIIVNDLPQIAAQMLCDGFTLELLDGEASHMPKKWISEVLRNLARLLKGKSKNDPRIYVLSVLGIQSTGKSTLLNTVFGVQFAVSAGRCTRGAFMQLVPVHSSLHEKTGVQYFLLIDTEGLRAPELERHAAFEHDNELATFVIGIANQTLINVAGEVAGEIDDVLNAAVHAFMRMSEVELKVRCHVVHQNVDVVDGDKLLQGRLKTKNKLDKMTKAAAKETELEAKYNCFNDIIHFNYKTDVSEFSGLRSGKLPMAKVSCDYTKSAQELKSCIIKVSKTHPKYRTSMPVLVSHLDKLWNAILQEDFVFTFQNTYELVAYKDLESKYSECSCKFTTEMNVLQQNAENELYGCIPTELDEKLKEHIGLIDKGASKHFKVLEKEMMDFLKTDCIMQKWKQDMELKLDHLRKELTKGKL